MKEPVAAFALMLALLLQGLASAWAAPLALPPAAPPAARSETAMPCHGDAAAMSDVAESHDSTGMNCCDGSGACTPCNAVCGTHPVPLAAMTPFDDYLDAHFALILRSDAVLLAHPLGLLRPPIAPHG